MFQSRNLLSYIGLTLFLIINFIFAIFFTNIRTDPRNIIIVLDPFSNENFGLTLISVIILFIGQLLLAIYQTTNKIRQENKISFFPEIDEKSSSDSHWGKFKPEEVKSILEKVAENSNVTVKKAYISTEIIPKVFSYNFKGGSVVILNSNLLEFCSHRELEAAISVELGFAKSKITSYITYLNFSSAYFLSILYAIPLFNMLRVILLTWFDSEVYKFELNRVITELFYLIIILMILSFVWKFHHIFIKFANRNIQYSSDNVATGLVGKKNMINMLIKLGQRTEALDILLEEIKWLESLHVGKVYPFDEDRLQEILQLFPTNELSEHEARRLSPNVFIKSRLTVLEESYDLEIPNLDDKIEHAAIKLRAKRKEDIEARKKQAKSLGVTYKDPVDDTLDWREFDTDGNLDLDEEEIEHFIASLKENKRKLLFENEMLGNLLFKGRIPINLRILAIYETKGEM